MIELKKLVSSRCDPYTLMGTSICVSEGCMTCISRTKCSAKALCIEIAVVATELNKPVALLFPSLDFFLHTIFEEKEIK